MYLYVLLHTHKSLTTYPWKNSDEPAHSSSMIRTKASMGYYGYASWSGIILFRSRHVNKRQSKQSVTDYSSWGANSFRSIADPFYHRFLFMVKSQKLFVSLWKKKKWPIVYRMYHFSLMHQCPNASHMEHWNLCLILPFSVCYVKIPICNFFLSVAI